MVPSMSVSVNVPISREARAVLCFQILSCVGWRHANHVYPQPLPSSAVPGTPLWKPSEQGSRHEGWRQASLDASSVWQWATPPRAGFQLCEQGGSS